MATRQYIGARYVPQFADPIEWNIDSSYDALTMVTNLNNCYISKKAVPRGIALNNSEYWVTTGQYNAYLEQLNQGLTNANNRISNLDTEFNGLNGEVENIKTQNTQFNEQLNTLDTNVEANTGTIDAITAREKTRYIVVMGDSFVVGTGGSTHALGNYISEMLGAEVKNYGYGGAGFIRKNTNGDDFLNAATESLTYENAQYVSDYIIVGGYNDLGLLGTDNWNENSFVNAVKNVVDKIRTVYKKANIYIAAMPTITSSYNKDYITLCKWLETGAVKAGAGVSSLALNWMFGMDGINSGDNVHPNNAGYKIIAGNICDAISGGSTGQRLYTRQSNLYGKADNYVICTQIDSMVLLQAYLDVPSDVTPFNTAFTLPAWVGNKNLWYVEFVNYDDTSVVKRAIIFSGKVSIGSDYLKGKKWIVKQWFPFGNL